MTPAKMAQSHFMLNDQGRENTMKKKFMAPEMSAVRFSEDNIITTSGIKAEDAVKGALTEKQSALNTDITKLSDILVF